MRNESVTSLVPVQLNLPPKKTPGQPGVSTMGLDRLPARAEVREAARTVRGSVQNQSRAKRPTGVVVGIPAGGKIFEKWILKSIYHFVLKIKKSGTFTWLN